VLFFEESLDYGPGLTVVLVIHALIPFSITTRIVKGRGRTPCSGLKKSGMQFLRRRSARARLRRMRLAFLMWPWCLWHGCVVRGCAGRDDVRGGGGGWWVGPMGGGGGAKALLCCASLSLVLSFRLNTYIDSCFDAEACLAHLRKLETMQALLS
jgi:hypothetical protein